VSVWFGRAGGPPTFTLLPDAPHYAASLMKLPLLAALHRQGAADEVVRVVNEFPSAAPQGGTYGLNRQHDPDDGVWERLGGEASLGWLAGRMITRSSNLAANLVLTRVGVAAADAEWRRAGATVSRIRRGIGDGAAEEAGYTNLVSAADAAILLGAAATDAKLLEPLLAQERTEDLAAGLPPGTRVALKNGWVRGVRHAAGIVYPDDAPPFVLSVCATTPLATNDPGDGACVLIRRVAAAAWADRHVHTGAATRSVDT
jgi:beta-lactamase class A